MWFTWLKRLDLYLTTVQLTYVLLVRFCYEHVIDCVHWIKTGRNPSIHFQRPTTITYKSNIAGFKIIWQWSSGNEFNECHNWKLITVYKWYRICCTVYSSAYIEIIFFYNPSWGCSWLFSLCQLDGALCMKRGTSDEGHFRLRTVRPLTSNEVTRVAKSTIEAATGKKDSSI